MPKLMCDFRDKTMNERCKNKAYREGYFKTRSKNWWSYLCRRHFLEFKDDDKRFWAWCSLD